MDILKWLPAYFVFGVVYLLHRGTNIYSGLPSVSFALSIINMKAFVQTVYVTATATATVAVTAIETMNSGDNRNLHKISPSRKVHTIQVNKNWVYSTWIDDRYSWSVAFINVGLVYDYTAESIYGYAISEKKWYYIFGTGKK